MNVLYRTRNELPNVVREVQGYLRRGHELTTKQASPFAFSWSTHYELALGAARYLKLYAEATRCSSDRAYREEQDR